MKKTASEIKARLEENVSHITFEYNGKQCGVDPVNDEYNMWYGGDHEYTAINATEVMIIPFFDGKALQDIVNDIKIIEF